MAPGLRRRARLVAATALALSLVFLLVGADAHAQTPLAMPAAPAAGKPQERMVVDARELVYNNDKNTVEAVGNVQILYQGRTIEADRVVYDRTSKRVVATGNARITEANGTITTGERFNLTDDFRDGFIDSLQVQNPDRTRFSAPRAERADGETFVFERGIYTACDACADNPERPPFWQVRAAKIIHKKSEQTIYYEDARLEFIGVPMAYLPFFSGPDSTVKRKSGFLAPSYFNTDVFGTGATIPYFFNLAPNYDITVRPAYLSRQGFLGQAEWRHRLANGSYSIQVAGISQNDTDPFLPKPFGPGDTRLRGAVETQGKFYINPRWNFGWNIAMATDRWFYSNYRFRTSTISSQTVFQESISSVYLNGQSPTAWFDLRGSYFQALSAGDWQKQQPVALPVLDYDKRVNKPSFLGGELSFNVNVTNLSREASAYQELPRQQTTLIRYENGAQLYDGCAVYQKNTCLIRGLAGNISRASAELAWRRNFIDSFGQVWTPHASLRADVFAVSPNTKTYYNAYASTITDTSNEVFGRAMPAIGLMYRYPFVAKTNWGTHVLEPVAQVVARPNETNALRVANEDSQSLVFDESNLFEWRGKFAGYDRLEGGSRANVGMLYTGRFGPRAYANALIGQSYQLTGRNSYQRGDLVNTGLDSGLDTRTSDIIARAQVSPFAGLVFTGATRLDEKTFEAQRYDAAATYSTSIFSNSIGYARYEPQPALGIFRRREGLSLSSSVLVTQNWRLTGGVLFDLDKYKYDRERYFSALETARLTGGTAPNFPTTGLFQLASSSVGVRYFDECTIFDVSYSQGYADRALGGTGKDSRSVLFRLELRTLGEIAYTQNLNELSGDGVR